MSHTPRFNLRRHLASAIGLPFVLAACVGSVDATDMAATNDSSEEADLEATSAELVSGSLPDGLALSVVPDGVGERVFTSHGFMFLAVATNNTAIATLQSDSKFLIVGDIDLQVFCKAGRDGRLYARDFIEHASVKPFSQKSVYGHCDSGDTVTGASPIFTKLYSDAPDIGYPANGCSSTSVLLISDSANNSAPDGAVNLCSGLTFKNKKRATWGSAEYINNGSSPVTVQQLISDVRCSGGGHAQKKWGPSTVAPGQTMTSTTGCPAGQTVTTALAYFKR